MLSFYLQRTFVPRPSSLPSKEELNVNLQRTNRIPQLKLFQHTRMQYAKAPNHLLLSSHPQMYLRRMPGQVRLIIHLANPVHALTHPLPLQALFTNHKSGLQHEHNAIHEPVYDFKAASFGNEGGGEVALVTAFALEGQVLEDYVADFEDLNRNAVVFVLSEGLEETGEEGCAHDLVFRRFRVGQSDGGGAIVHAIQVCKVLCVRAEDQGKNFRPACHCRLESYDVAEFVDGEGLGDGA